MPKKHQYDSGVSGRNTLEERRKFYEDLAEKTGIEQGDPLRPNEAGKVLDDMLAAGMKKEGSSVQNFLGAAERTAKGYKPTGVIVSSPDEKSDKK